MNLIKNSVNFSVFCILSAMTVSCSGGLSGTATDAESRIVTGQIDLEDAAFLESALALRSDEGSDDEGDAFSEGEEVREEDGERRQHRGRPNRPRGRPGEESENESNEVTCSFEGTVKVRAVPAEGDVIDTELEADGYFMIILRIDQAYSLLFYEDGQLCGSLLNTFESSPTVIGMGASDFDFGLISRDDSGDFYPEHDCEDSYDTDEDGLSDAEDDDFDGDGVYNDEEEDADNDGLVDDWDDDDDDDGTDDSVDEDEEILDDDAGDDVESVDTEI